MGFGAILAGAGALSSVLGGSSGKTKSTPVSGYGALPKDVQDLWMKQFIPGVADLYSAGQRQIPLQRAIDPSIDPFASQAAWNFQKYSDSLGGGGFFGQPQQMQPQAQAPAGVDASGLGALIAAMGGMPGTGMSNLGMARSIAPQLARMNIAKKGGRDLGANKSNYDSLTALYKALGGQ